MTAYAEAYLGKDAVAPADAITASPYLGFESLRPALDLAARTGRGVFVLGLTSNPEGRTVQHARLRDVSVAETIVQGAAAENAAARERGELGSVGLVVGATVGLGGAGARPRPGRLQRAPARAGRRAPRAAPARTCARSSATPCRTSCRPAAARSCRAGPDVAGLRDRAVSTSEAMAGLLGHA